MTEVKRKTKHSLFTIDGFIYQSRWLIYLINLGLMVALAVYIVSFIWNVAQLLMHVPEMLSSPGHSNPELMIAVVTLLDQAMISSLLVLTIMGGHQIYVRRFRCADQDDMPQWLDHIDSIILKVKMGLAFVGVSSVMLLEDAISASTVPEAIWKQHLIIHVVFLATTLVTAIVWRLMKAPLK